MTGTLKKPRVALIETKPSRTNFKSEFEHEFEFDQFQLCSNPSLKKVLKRDCDIEFNPDEYDWVILVGSDAFKYYTKNTSISEYSGKCVDQKFLPVINPSMLAFKPEMRHLWETSKNTIIKYIKGEEIDYDVSSDQTLGIQDSATCNAFIRAAINSPNTHIGLDSETSALYPRNGYVLGFSLSYEEDYGAYIDTACFTEETEKLLQELFNKKIVIFHNSKFDLGFFEYHFNFNFPRWEDTMLLHYLIDENPGTHGLKQLAVKYTKYGDYEKDLQSWITRYCRENKVLKSEFSYEVIPFEVMVPYAAIDAIVTLILFNKFKVLLENPKHKRLKGVYENLLKPGTRMLLDIQENGVPFDKARLQFSKKTMQADIDRSVAELYKYDEIKAFEEIQGKEFNPNSVMQLRQLLFDYLGLNPTGKKTGTGADSTDAEVLEALASQSRVPAFILDIRRKSKIKNTYLDKIIPQLDMDSRLRTGFNLHTTTSGRLSSSGKLNMQQLPRDNPTVKGCIKASEGCSIVSMDLTTAEVYVAAVLADDKALKEIFKQGGDFHGAIAKKVFNLPSDVDEVKSLYPLQRQAAKAVTFGIMYGAGANKISEQVTKDSGVFFSPQEAQEVIDDYFAEFHRLDAWIKHNKRFIEDNGFLYSFYGRKRRLENVKSTDRATKSHSIRSGLNFLVQSTASDINLLAAIDMNAWLKASGNTDNAKIFGLVHDSILAEVKNEFVEEYSERIAQFVQMDRGVMIPGSPIGVDIEVGEDYSFGKFGELYGDILQESA